MPASDDPYVLSRFVSAQDRVIEQVRAELRAGRKQSHWMWFIFPQLKGLGSSQMAQHYGIGSREEAQAYLRHNTLGPRLDECTRLVNAIEGRAVEPVFGYPDDLKFHSSMTLFAAVAGQGSVFDRALAKYFDGAGDTKTLERLKPA